MKASEKVLFVIGAVLSIVALLLGCLAAYFGASALIAVHVHGANGAESIGVAFMLVFLLIFSFASWGTALLAVILLLIRPARTQHPRVRRWSRVHIILLLMICLLLGVLLLYCFF